MLGRVAELRRGSYWIPLLFALSSSEANRQSAKVALNFLKRARENLYRVEPSKQPQQEAWLSFSEGSIYQILGLHGANADRDKAINLFKTLAKSEQIAGGAAKS